MAQIDVRIVTYAGCPPGGDYDSVHLLKALGELGLSTDFRAWDDPTTDWREAIVTVIRSTWDYHHDVRRFLDWADRTALGTRLFNPPDLLRWNVHKSYLIDLEHDSVPIVPTIIAGPAEALAAGVTVNVAGWHEIVIKPAVSLDGHGVIRALAGSAEAIAGVADICETGAAIIQPFLPEFVSVGELSLIFIDGAFAHAVRKRPAAGEFRVQERLGGTVESDVAPERALALAELVLSTLDEAPLYARVDMIESAIAGTGTRYLLTELELVEPSLFLAAGDGTAAILADAIAARLQATHNESH